MSTDLGSLQYTITLNSQAFESGLDAANNKAKSTASALKSSFNDLESGLNGLGSTLTMGLTLPIVAAGTAAVKMSTDFQQQMTYVRTQAGDTTDDIQKLSNQVLDLAQSSQFGPEELAKGLYHVTSLGLRGADAMNALNTAQQLAAVGGADLEETSTALGSALVTNIKGVQDYSQAAGTLNAIIGSGNMRMQDLVGALGTGVLTVFKNAGLTLTDFGASLATLTDNGQDASAAAHHLQMTIALLEAPSVKAAKVMADIGLTSTQLGMDMQTKGLIPALQDLQKHLIDTYGTTAEGKQKIAAALTEMFGGGRSSSAIQTLLDQLDRVQNKEQQISDTSGQFADDVAKQQETASARIQTAWSGIQADAIKLGGDIMPIVASVFTQVAGAVESVVDWYNSLGPAQRALIGDLIEGAVVAGPLLLGLGKVIAVGKDVGSVITGISGVVQAIIGIAAPVEAAAGEVASVGVAAGGAEVGMGGLLAVLTGPLGIGMLAAGAAIAGGIWWLNQDRDTTEKARQESEKLAGSKDLLKIAQDGVTDATAQQKQATDKLADAEKQSKPTSDALADAQKNLAAKQKDVNDARDKYGAGSPQYQKAVSDEKQVQQDLALKMLDSAKNTLTVVDAKSQLTDANNKLKDATQYLADMQGILAKGLDSPINKIKDFGPAAQLGFGPLDTLDLKVLKVIKDGNNMDTQFGNIIQGLGSDLDKLQKTVNSVNLGNNFNSAALHAGTPTYTGKGTAPVQGVKQFASGVENFEGGWAIVGEKGWELAQLPAGTNIYSHDQSQKMMGNTYHIANVNLSTAPAVQAFFDIDNRNIQLSGMGMSPLAHTGGTF